MSTTQHARIVAALSAWIAQRPGLDPRDYISDWQDAAGRNAYRSESRRITRQGHDARTLLREVDATGPHSDAAWADAFRAFSGRLTWDADKGTLSYATGQYWPTEYRAAAAAVLASLLWARYRDGMPEPATWAVVDDSAWDGAVWRKGKVRSRHATEAEAMAACGANQSVSPLYGARQVPAGTFLRESFRNRFGARMQRAWFH